MTNTIPESLTIGMNTVMISNTFYSLVEILRAETHMSMRQMSTAAHMPPATMTATMRRRPDRVSLYFVRKIADVFGVDWREMLGSTAKQFEEADENTRIPAEIPETEFMGIVENLRSKVKPLPHDPHASIHVRPYTSPMNCSCSTNIQYRTTINLMLNQLNSDGLLEIMEHAIHLTKDERYRKK